MPKRIEEDHDMFKDVYAGRIRKELKKHINNGSIFRKRGDGKHIKITIPKIDIPHIVYGNNGKGGIGRGPGKEGDVIGKDDKGKGKGNKAGDDHVDGIDINISQDDIVKFMKEELQLPDQKPKPNQTYEDTKIKYNDISLRGPESLRHNRRTILQAMRRLSATGEIKKKHIITGFTDPISLIEPINSDRRYRQYKEVKIPSSNAVIFFARDGSGSMDQYKCDIVSDMAWWVDVFIRQYYKRVERCYVWHDTEAAEVDEKKFYTYRYGGGTYCSSAMKFINSQLEERFKPEKWNIYIFYFTDGENADSDNESFKESIEKNFPENIVNFIGITQVMSNYYENSLKQFVDSKIKQKNVRTTSVGIEQRTPTSGIGYFGGLGGYDPMYEEERDNQIKKAIIDLLGTGVKKAPEVAQVAANAI